MEAADAPYDIDDGVDRADLVEVHLVDGHLVDFGFGLRQAAKMSRAIFFVAGARALSSSMRSIEP